VDDLGFYLKMFADTDLNKRDLEKHLRLWGLSVREAKIIASECGRPITVVKPKQSTIENAGSKPFPSCLWSWVVSLWRATWAILKQRGGER
jgi:hypothetical protein